MRPPHIRLLVVIALCGATQIVSKQVGLEFFVPGKTAPVLDNRQERLTPIKKPEPSLWYSSLPSNFLIASFQYASPALDSQVRLPEDRAASPAARGCAVAALLPRAAARVAKRALLVTSPTSYQARLGVLNQRFSLVARDQTAKETAPDCA